MIGSLSGKLEAIDRQRLLVNTGNVGYWVLVAPQEITRYTQGQTLSLYIHTHVREDALQLYGFATLAELRLFEQLLTVSGVGPKLALNVFAAGNANAISQAVTRGDVEFFTSVSGIGKKNAQRLIIDLKGKVGAAGDSLDLSDSDDELVNALVGFGFSKAEIAAAIKQLDTGLPVEEQLKLALKSLGGK
jgi:Holliday junction DNA helicase RuvA